MKNRHIYPHFSRLNFKTSIKPYVELFKQFMHNFRFCASLIINFFHEELKNLKNLYDSIYSTFAKPLKRLLKYAYIYNSYGQSMMDCFTQRIV